MPHQEDIDNNYASDPGIDRVSQEVWGLRYIDDTVFRRSYNPDIMEEEPEAHHYHCTDAQFSTLAMIGTGANPVLFERVRYRSYGEAAHRFPGDFNDDSYCNSSDQTLLTNALNATIGQGAYDVAIDLNRDGVINSSDQTQFNWWSGRTPLSAGRISDAGNSAAGPGPDNPFGYCGYAFNAENLLYTVRFRHYEPVSGRWLERDPAGYVDGYSLFQYARGKPLAFVDPLGLACDPPSEESRDHPDSWWRQSGRDPELYPHRSKFLDEYCIPLAFTTTFLEEVSPDIDIKYGFYEPIDEIFTCCRDGREQTCTKTGFRILLGVDFGITAEWKVELPIVSCATGCPADGRYHEVMTGEAKKAKTPLGGGKASFQIGARLHPDGEVTTFGDCAMELALPGITVGMTAAEDDFIVKEIVAVLKKEIGVSAGVNAGRYSTFVISCKPTGNCCKE